MVGLYFDRDGKCTVFWNRRVAVAELEHVSYEWQFLGFQSSVFWVVHEVVRLQPLSFLLLIIASLFVGG